MYDGRLKLAPNEHQSRCLAMPFPDILPFPASSKEMQIAGNRSHHPVYGCDYVFEMLVPSDNMKPIEVSIITQDPVPMLATIDYNCSGVYDTQTHSHTLILEWNLLPRKCSVPVTYLFNGFTVLLVLNNKANKTFIPVTSKTEDGLFKVSYPNIKPLSQGSPEFLLLPHSLTSRSSPISCSVQLPWIYAPPTNPHIIQYSIDEYNTAHLLASWGSSPIATNTATIAGFHYSVSVTEHYPAMSRESPPNIYEITVPLQQLFIDAWFPVSSNRSDLFIQVQLVNKTCHQPSVAHSCSSPWSESIPLEPKSCYSRNNSETVEPLSSGQQAVTNARCLAACIDKYVSSSDLTAATGSPWPSISLDQLNCTTSNQVELCYKGCVIKGSSKTRISDNVCTLKCVMQCKDECGGSLSCRNSKRHCSRSCEFISCNEGCGLWSGHLGDAMTLSTGLPYVTPTMAVNGGEYRLALHSDDEDGSRNTVLVTDRVFLIKVTKSSYEEYFIIQESLSMPLILTYFDCEMVQLSVAMVTSTGMSNYSEPISTYIYGETLFPSHPNNSSYVLQVEEDFRTYFKGHSIILLSWERPHNFEYLDYYKVRVSTGDQECGKALSLTVPKNATSVVIQSVSPDDLPKFSCEYKIVVESFPSKPGDDPESVFEFIHPPPITTNCSLEFQDPLTGEFRVQIEWTYPNIPSVIEATKYVLITSVLSADNQWSKIRRPYRVLPRNGVTSYTEVFTFPPIPHANQPNVFRASLSPLRKNTLLHRKIPPSMFCFLELKPHKPSSVDITDVIVSELSQHSVNITLESTHPSQPYSASVKYDLIISDKEMHSNGLTAVMTDNSTRIFITNNNSSRFTVNETNKFSGSCLFAQVRARTPYSVGEWSTPPFVMAMDGAECQQIQSSTSQTSSSTVLVALLTTKNIRLTTSANGAVDSTNSSAGTSTVTTSTSSSTGTSESSSILTVTDGVQSVDQLVDVRYHATVSIPVIAGTVTVCILVLGISVIVGSLMIMKYKKNKIIKSMDDGLSDWCDINHVTKSHVISNNIVPDQWELPQHCIMTKRLITEGWFGQVYCGHVRQKGVGNRGTIIPHDMRCKDTIPVAIKLLKEGASKIDKNDFLNEIEILKRLCSPGSSPNHVAVMIGCVTIQEPVCLVTSLAKHGDLKSYLKYIRQQLNEEYVNDDEDPYKSLGAVTPTDLLSFGYQIASGMEYISSHGIIHCDLAARNVLVDDKTLKISDFGMSRITGAEQVYTKTTHGGRLPWKWMAIESLQRREFSTFTDVWAYGVTLWEIATLGGYPYPAVTNGDVLAYLENGERLEQPLNVSSELYDVMFSCWCLTPTLRPSFTKLKGTLGNLISTSTDHTYIDLMASDLDNYVSESLKDILGEITTDGSEVFH